MKKKIYIFSSSKSIQKVLPIESDTYFCLIRTSEKKGCGAYHRGTILSTWKEHLTSLKNIVCVAQNMFSHFFSISLLYVLPWSIKNIQWSCRIFHVVVEKWKLWKIKWKYVQQSLFIVMLTPTKWVFAFLLQSIDDGA